MTVEAEATPGAENAFSNKYDCCKKSQTNDMEANSDAKKGFQITKTLLNLLLYLLYIAIVCITMFGTTTTGRYHLTKVIYFLFIDAPFTGYGGQTTSFRESTTFNDFWGFTKEAMPEGLYLKEWHFNKEFIDKPDTDPKTAWKYDNRLVGRARIRQVRVVNQTCPAAKLVPKNIALLKCYPLYEKGKEDRQPFHKILGDEEGWYYETKEQLHEEPSWGSLATYTGAGYTHLLETNSISTEEILTPMKNNLWITRATRAIFLEFTLFNPNINVFCVVKLLWEVPATGGVHTSWDIQTITFLRYTTFYEQIVLVCEIAFLGFTIFYIFQEIVYLFLHGWKKYFCSVWTYLTFAIFGLSAFCIEYNFRRYFILNEIVESLGQLSNKFVDVHHLTYSERIYRVCSSILMLLIWVKLFKFLSFNRSMSLLAETITRCAKDIGGFGIIFLIVLLAFAQLGHVLFGTQVHGFRTFLLSIFTLSRFILGDFLYTELKNANRLLGPIFFLAYVIFVFMILVNMFLAIINDSFHAMQEKVEKDEDKINVNECLMALNCCRKPRPKDLDKEVFQDVKDICIEPREIKRQLKMRHFSELEIEIFLSKFDVAESDLLDADEAHQLLSNITHNVHRNNEFEGPLNRRNEKPLPVITNVEKRQQIAKAEVEILVDRLGFIESAVVDVVAKIERLLTRAEHKLEVKQNSNNAKRSSEDYKYDQARQSFFQANSHNN